LLLTAPMRRHALR
ncbi:type III secretion system regulator LcrR, partial [Vibrio parahaemolyticus IDH02640]